MYLKKAKPTYAKASVGEGGQNARIVELFY
jgi:hypothetical protein